MILAAGTDGQWRRVELPLVPTRTTNVYRGFTTRLVQFGFRLGTGGEITSDAGLVALREFDHRIGFTDSLVACLHDDRHRSYVIHDLMQLIIQRLYAIVAGYEDQNDADKLREDGLF